MNARTIIDLETCQSNPKFETVALVAKELNISVDAAIFPDMVNQTVSKTVVDFFAGKSDSDRYLVEVVDENGSYQIEAEEHEQRT